MEALEIEENRPTHETCNTILSEHGLTWKETEYYLAVGKDGSGHIVYLSIVQSQIYSALRSLIPYLISEGIFFKVVKDIPTAESLLSGRFGVENIGKVFIINIPLGKDNNQVNQRIGEILKGFTGPAVPGFIRQDDVVFAKPDPKSLSQQGKKELNILGSNYLVISTLKQDPKGNVYKCFYMNSLFSMGFCVIKEGRKFMWSDEYARDMSDRLKWQYKVHEELGAVVKVPGVKGIFYDKENTYFAMQFIKGKSIRQIIKEIYQERNWDVLPLLDKNKLLDLLIRVLEMVNKIHNKGFVHRDITPENFIISPDNQLYVIDLELSYDTKLNQPFPSFKLGSPGYMSKEQRMGKEPTFKEDIYALGALMVVLFTNIQVANFGLQNLNWAKDSILSIPKYLRLTDIITKCLSDQPELRPTIQEIKAQIVDVKQKSTFQPSL